MQCESHNDLPLLVPGQQVIWAYQPQRRRSEFHTVAAEVVQISQLRVRIRVHIASGTPLLRWVHPKHLRLSAPDELTGPYPE